MNLVLPFVACKSQGGIYDDDSFVAGFQCGEIDRALGMASLVRATTIKFPMVHTALIEQLDLVAMRHLYTMAVTVDDEHPQWVAVTFSDGQPPIED